MSYGPVDEVCRSDAEPSRALVGFETMIRDDTMDDLIAIFEDGVASVDDSGVVSGMGAMVCPFTPSDTIRHTAWMDGNMFGRTIRYPDLAASRGPRR